MTAPRTPTKSHEELAPETFLAGVHESATSAAKAVAEFLTAVEHGCSEQKMHRSGQIEPVKALSENWPGAVGPDCVRALESCMALISVFLPGEPDITAPYTPPENLLQHARMLRGIHRTAVNLCDLLWDIRDRLQTNQPWIYPAEIKKLRTLKEAVQDYSVNNDATGTDPVEDSFQSEPTVVADPSNVSGSHIRLRLDPTSRIVTLDGTAHSLDSECTLLVAGLIEADGKWITSAKLMAPHNIKTRAGRIMGDLPGPIENCIESKPGKGYKLVVPAAIR